MIIDAHAHIIPGDFPEVDDFPTMMATDREDVRRLLFGRTDFRAHAAFFAADRRLEALDAAGVDEEVLSPMPPLLNFALPVPVARDLFRYVNDTMAQFVSRGGGRFHGLGVVPLQDPALACEELGRVAELGLRGVEVGSHIDGVAIGDARFAEFFHEIARRDLTVFVHALPRRDETGLTPAQRPSIGVGIEAARGAASMVAAGDSVVSDRILFSHAAGGLPMMLSRADHFWAQSDPEERPDASPSDIARRFLYDSMVFDPRALRFVIDYLGADRVVLGTDFPAMPRPPLLGGVLDAVDASEAERDLIGSANMRRFLREHAKPAGTMP